MLLNNLGQITQILAIAADPEDAAVSTTSHRAPQQSKAATSEYSMRGGQSDINGIVHICGRDELCMWQSSHSTLPHPRSKFCPAGPSMTSNPVATV